MKLVLSQVLSLAIPVRGTFTFQRYRRIYACDHEFTNPRLQVSRASAFCTPAPNTYGSTVWKFLYATQATGPEEFVEALRFFCKKMFLLISHFSSIKKTYKNNYNNYYYYCQYYYYRHHHVSDFFKCLDFLCSSCCMFPVTSKFNAE